MTLSFPPFFFFWQFSFALIFAKLFVVKDYCGIRRIFFGMARLFLVFALICLLKGRCAFKGS